jgi:hypothetical protein
LRLRDHRILRSKDDTMTNSLHLSEPTDSGVLHDWCVGDARGSVSLSALHFGADVDLDATLAQMPAAGDLAAHTPDGTWLFDVMQSHRPVDGPQWPCSRHDACEMDAYVSLYASRIWDRIRDNGVTDEAVFAELAVVYAVEFDGAAF